MNGVPSPVSSLLQSTFSGLLESQKHMEEHSQDTAFPSDESAMGENSDRLSGHGDASSEGNPSSSCLSVPRSRSSSPSVARPDVTSWPDTPELGPVYDPYMLELHRQHWCTIMQPGAFSTARCGEQASVPELPDAAWPLVSASSANYWEPTPDEHLIHEEDDAAAIEICDTSDGSLRSRAALDSALAGAPWRKRTEAGWAERGEPKKTTVMLRNMPNNQSREMLVELLNAMGFERLFDFVYLPMDFKTRASLGYAFVNFVSHEEASRAFRVFSGFSRWSIKSRKVCGVDWSGPHQGLSAHLERYRNSDVMHLEVPDAFKPAVYLQGERAAFPPPTKRLRAPRPRDAR